MAFHPKTTLMYPRKYMYHLCIHVFVGSCSETLVLASVFDYRISSNLSDTSNYPGHSFGQFLLF